MSKPWPLLVGSIGDLDKLDRRVGDLDKLDQRVGSIGDLDKLDQRSGLDQRLGGARSISSEAFSISGAALK